MFRRRDRPGLSTRVRQALLPRGGWRRGLEYLAHRVRRLPDTPHRIALGFACGAFASFTPLFGLHLLLAAGLAKLLRCNILAALFGTFVGNPLTFPFIASASLWLGRRIIGFGVTGRHFSRVTEAFADAAGALWRSLLSLVGRGEPEWSLLLPFLRDVFWPYLVGGIAPGLAAAALSYYLLRPLVAAYQLRRQTRMAGRAQARLREKSEADAAAGAAYKPGNGGRAKHGTDE